MTLCHIQLRKINEDDSSVTYAAITPDFNDEFMKEKMAEIIVRKGLNTYEFIPGEKWKSGKTLPPLFFSFPEEKQNEMLENEYKGYANGAWTMRIHRWISNFLQKGIFPDRFPK